MGAQRDYKTKYSNKTTESAGREIKKSHAIYANGVSRLRLKSLPDNTPGEKQKAP
jgi:hypothetical protein